MKEFFAWETLGTFSGCALAVGILTQLLKGSVGRLPARLLSYLLSVVLLGFAAAASGGFSQPWQTWALLPLNAVVVSLSSNGAYDAIEGSVKKTD